MGSWLQDYCTDIKYMLHRHGTESTGRNTVHASAMQACRPCPRLCKSDRRVSHVLLFFGGSEPFSPYFDTLPRRKY